MNNSFVLQNTERQQLVDFISANRTLNPELANMCPYQVQCWQYARSMSELYSTAEEIAKKGDLKTMPDCTEYVAHLAHLGHI